jgi:Ran-binding protein 9/10
MAQQQQPRPTQWDATGARSPALRFLQISGTRVKYVGPGSDDRDAASVRTNVPVPSHSSLFYYEVEIVNRGRDGFIGIGFATQDVKLDRLPGKIDHRYDNE